MVAPLPISVLTLKLQLQTDKIPFVRPHHLPKFWNKKAKATNMVILRVTNNKKYLEIYWKT